MRADIFRSDSFLAMSNLSSSSTSVSESSRPIHAAMAVVVRRWSYKEISGTVLFPPFSHGVADGIRDVYLWSSAPIV